MTTTQPTLRPVRARYDADTIRVELQRSPVRIQWDPERDLRLIWRGPLDIFYDNIEGFHVVPR